MPDIALERAQQVFRVVEDAFLQVARMCTERRKLPGNGVDDARVGGGVPRTSRATAFTAAQLGGYIHDQDIAFSLLHEGADHPFHFDPLAVVHTGNRAL